jgi:hypothetical protein
MKNIMFTLVIRPRIESGVCMCRMILRRTVLTMSEAPTRSKQQNVSQKTVEIPKATVANA